MRAAFKTSIIFNMTKHGKIALFVIFVALLSGCFSIDRSPIGKNGNEHVVVANYGWTLFNRIPLFCGNATSPEKTRRVGPWAFFRDDVTMEKLQGRFLELAAQEGREATDLVYHDYNTVLMTLPMSGITIPIPYLICYRELQLSGVLK